MQRLANALVHLKRVFPGANAALLVARQPALALHADLARLEAAGQELRELLPGVDVDRREQTRLLLAPAGGTVLLEELLRDSVWLVDRSLSSVLALCNLAMPHAGRMWHTCPSSSFLSCLLAGQSGLSKHATQHAGCESVP